VRSQGDRPADGYAGRGSGCGCPSALDRDLVPVGEQHVGQQHALKGVVAKVAMPVEPVSEVVAVLAIGSEVGDGDGTRHVGEIALDAWRRQAAGPIGVHHDRDVTVLEAGTHPWSPGTARDGIPQPRAEIMSGGPSASTIHRDGSAAGWGMRPRRVPGVAIIFAVRVAIGA
jgi:hypothetical protein